MRNLALFIIGFVLLIAALGLQGCATTGYAGGKAGPGTNYDKFHDSYGEYRLVSRNNDLYMEKLDGSESKRITHTPKIKEDWVFISKDGKYVFYIAQEPAGILHGTDSICYKTPIEKSGSGRIKIDDSEYHYYRKEAEKYTKPFGD